MFLGSGPQTIELERDDSEYLVKSSAGGLYYKLSYAELSCQAICLDAFYLSQLSIKSEDKDRGSVACHSILSLALFKNAE